MVSTRVRARRTASYIGAGIIGTPGGGAAAVPPGDWRMPAAVAVSSGLSASGAALSAGSATAAAKTRPSFAVASGGTEYVEWTVQEAGTALLSWLGMSSGTAAVTKNGADLGFAPAFPAGSDADGSNGPTGRRQFIKVPVIVGDVLRLTLAAGAAARTIYPLLHKIPATGPWDAHLVIGASREDNGMGSKDVEDLVIAMFPTHDPVVFNYAKSGATLDEINTYATTFAPLYAGAAFYAVVGNIIGNVVTANAPYTSSQKAALDATIATLMGKLTGYTIAMGNTSYRAYAGVTPQDQSGGSLPYNDNVIHPAIATYAPAYYDNALQRARVDEYLAILYARGSLSDSTHGAGVAQRENWRDSHFAYVYSGSWTGIKTQTETRVAAAEAVATNKATALTTYNEASYAVSALAATSGKTAYQARLSAIYPTVLFYEAVRLVDVAVTSSASGDKATAQTALNNAAAEGYSGSTAPNTIAAQQARLDAIVVASFDQVVKIGHGGSTAVTGWNRTTSIALGVAIANLNNDAGAATGIGLEVTDAPSGVSNNTGMVSAVPEIPDAILANAWADITNSMAFKFTGLDPAKTYDLVLMPCRSTATVSSTKYTVQGVVRTPDIPNNNNQSTTLVIAGITPNASGEITVIAARGAGSSYCYHTASILKRRAA